MKPISGAKFCSAFLYYKEKTLEELLQCVVEWCSAYETHPGWDFHLNKGLIVLEGVK